MAGSYQMRTKNNYDFFHCASTLQKAIRRGEEEVAMFFMVELAISGYDEYVWKRLKIISSEDVGLAEPNISSNIAGLYSMYVEQKKKKDEKHAPERLFITHAVLMLCRAKKSRLVDWTLIAFWKSHQEKLMEVPDYAYDKHNQKGRSMGRGVDHFYEEGSKLFPHSPLQGEEEMKMRARDAENIKQPGAASEVDKAKKDQGPAGLFDNGDEE